ncbi:MAG: dinitrogenase iron-molybdenum cofactor biosynthesis protein [Candidatus Eisenbacteria bacterium]|nr:dinitrogenase iron-molybdenum cofactor biosynthesis protein [Candidatus Eisenbacteria bacterium]
MIVGIPAWGERVSPVLDAAEQLVVLESGTEGRGSGRVVNLSGLSPWRRVAAIRKAGVEVLICGAVTRPLMESLSAGGVQVVPWVSGRMDEVLEAFAAGRLQDGRFSMPGCGRMRRRGMKRGRGKGRGGRGGGGRGPGGARGTSS